MEKAIAIVVSYNRISLLKECITALRNQTRRPDAILVVNNGSTDNTEDWLSQQSDLFYITQPNFGSGGGFNTGISWAFKNGYSWIWCMDDDGYPKEDAFENLLANQTNHQCLLNCAVIDKNDKSSFVWKTKNYKTIEDVNEPLIKGIGHPFNGTLLHRSIVEKVGVPKATLFLWGDETEYYYRIVKQHAIPVYTVTSSIHYHPATAFSYKNDWDFAGSWKMYYYVRNRFHILKAKHRFRFVAFVNYAAFLAAFAAVVLYYQKTDKTKKLSFLSWPVKDAFSHDFRATPSSIILKLQEKDLRENNSPLLNSLRNFWYSLPRPMRLGRTNAAES